MSRLIEEGRQERLDFQKIAKVAAAKEDVVPVVVQDAETGEVLILAFANREALDYSLRNGLAAFYSTSRKELWIKGKDSGDVLELLEVRVNCEQNSLLYLVRPKTGAACHTKDADGNNRPSCYYRRLEKDGSLSFVPPAAEGRTAQALRKRQA